MNALDKMFDDPMSQLDRIEAKLDKLLEKKKPKPRSSKVEYPDWFENIWKLYPKRAGCNPKNRALECAKVRMFEGEYGMAFDEHVRIAMMGGVKRYAAYCDATSRTGTEYVYLASTFFGPSDPKHYECDWKIPEQAKKTSLPTNDEDLEAFAVKHNLHPEGHAPRHLQNMKQYRQWIQERL